MAESETEQVYSAREVATALGVGAAMLRRYSAAYERLTGTEIEIHKRDGRLFNQAQLDTLLAARALVQRQDMPVGVAMETVLRDDEAGLAVRASSGAAVDTLALTEALRTAVTDPLLSELASIKAELTALRADNQELRQGQELPNPARNETQHGLLVRVALWVERRFR